MLYLSHQNYLQKDSDIQSWERVSLKHMKAGNIHVLIIQAVLFVKDGNGNGISLWSAQTASIFICFCSRFWCSGPLCRQVCLYLSHPKTKCVVIESTHMQSEVLFFDWAAISKRKYQYLTTWHWTWRCWGSLMKSILALMVSFLPGSGCGTCRL